MCICSKFISNLFISLNFKFMRKFSPFIFIFTLIVGCENSNIIDTNCRSITINSEFTDTSKVKFDDFFTFDNYVVLESTPEALFGRIDKLVIKGDHMYIASQFSIYTFDKSGKFITKLYRYGRANNEYQFINDFIVNDDLSLTVYDGMQGKLITYKNNEYANSCDIDRGMGVIDLGNNKKIISVGSGYADNTNDSPFRYIVKEGDETIAGCVPFSEHLLGRQYTYGMGKSEFYKFDNNIYATPQMNDTIYTINKLNGEIKPFITFNFPGVVRPQADWNKSNIDKYLSALDELKEVPSQPFCFYKFGDYVMVKYILIPGGTRYVIADGEKVLYHFNPSVDVNKLPLNNVIPFINENDGNTGQMISVLIPSYLKSLTKENDPINYRLVNEIGSKITDDSNPVLVFYNWNKQ